MIKLQFKYWWLALMHGALVAALVWNLTRLIEIRGRVLATLELPITASDPAAFRQRLVDSLPDWWVWGITVVGIIVGIAFVITTLHPQLGAARRWRIAGSIWLLVWAGYLVGILVLANIALSQLFA